MPYKVLVVDDSGFFRRRVSEQINLDRQLEVIDVACNGLEAIRKAKLLAPDVITMDIEMPQLDGISAVRQIMSTNPIPIMMFSTFTTDGAKPTLEALDAGAIDFLPKKFEDIAKDCSTARDILCERIKMVACSRVSKIQDKPIASSKSALFKVEPRANNSEYDLVAIGASTGGPVALQEVLTKLPADFPLPILLIQHMPANFTGLFAKRLNSICQITVKEAEDGELLRPQTAFLAPGGKQMTIINSARGNRIKVYQDTSQRYHPCIDISLQSLLEPYGSSTLVIILTGMGADGCESAKLLKQKGATIWSQDEDSCAVFGMPAAIINAGISDNILPLATIGKNLNNEI